MGVKVTLTVEAGNGELSCVDPEGDTYEQAKVNISGNRLEYFGRYASRNRANE